MSANVQCAGDGEWYAAAVVTPAGQRLLNPPVRLTVPCGWEAFRTGYITGYNPEKREWMHGPPTIVGCPRCGGRVELIPSGGGG